MNWTIPNILTALRLIAAPAVVIATLAFQDPLSYWIALIIFVVAGLTDFVDGYLARLWKQETAFGKMMDPIADKTIVIMTLIALLVPFKFSALIMIPTLVIIFREILVSGLREFLGNKSNLLSVTRLAKWKTSFQIIAICSLYIALLLNFYQMSSNDNVTGIQLSMILEKTPRNHSSILLIASICLLWIATILTFLSGYEYLLKAIKFISEKNKND